MKEMVVNLRDRKMKEKRKVVYYKSFAFLRRKDQIVEFQRSNDSLLPSGSFL